MKRLVPFLFWLHSLSLTHGQADRPPELSTVVFRNVAVVDVVNGRIEPGQAVVVREGHILQTGPDDQAPSPAEGLEVDGCGRYLIPGLWDMHTHWYEQDSLPLFIANGVTGIRMMVGFPLHHEWRRSISSGELIGPRLLIASGVLDGPKPVWPISIVVGNEEQAREAVRRSRETGADFIKVYSHLPREAYFAIADESGKLGLPFVGHVPDLVLAQEAAEAGQKSIEHLTGVRLACSNQREELLTAWQEAFQAAREAGDNKPWVKAAERIESRLEETQDSMVAAKLFALFKENGTWQCPTLIVGRNIGHLNDPELIRDPRLEYISTGMRQSWDPKNDFRFRDVTDEQFAERRQRVEQDLNLVRSMHQAGVPLLAGTDTGNPYCFPGFSLHDELGLLVQAGLTPAEALRTATINPARFMGRTESMGSIAEGLVADLVLLDANPFEDIGNARKIRGVMAGGRWFDRQVLDELLDRVKDLAGRDSIGRVLFEIIRSEGLAAAISKYRELRANEPDQYDFGEGQLNMLGYRLLEAGRTEDAVGIFRLNVEMFPRAWNAYDSLAEAYLKQGMEEQAKRNYRRSLELNPGNEGAARALELLEAGPPP
ncbi:MAG TPA: amidohydrolase family protein [Methylomirabilota bacterium]|nr:amidohydrolase family protein [Methylomirabilota bacterium]